MRPWHSMMGRVVICLLLGGLALSAGTTWLEFTRTRDRLRLELSGCVSTRARSIGAITAGMAHDADLTEAELRAAVSVALDEPAILAARVSGPELPTTTVGDWPAADLPTKTVALATAGTPHGVVDLDEQTLLRAETRHHGHEVLVELIVDGPGTGAAIRSELFERAGNQWLLVGVLTLLGLLLLRRWIVRPLAGVVELVRQGAGPGQFRRFAERERGEFAELTGSIAAMLDQIDETASRLVEREQAFASLYQLAPSAMLSLDHDGLITEANARAATMLGAGDEASLIGRRAVEYVSEADQPLLQQTIDRLSVEDQGRCELRLTADAGGLDVTVEAVAIRCPEGRLRSVRLAMIDTGELKALNRQVADKSRLMNLVLDHMSDAIVLVGNDGKIATYNRKLAELLHRRPDSLHGETVDHGVFWDELEIINKELFVDRLRQIEADNERPAQERFEMRSGVFVFQGIPVQDAAGETIGRMWVVQETTAQEQTQRMAHQQGRQLQALKRVGGELFDVDDVDTLLERAVQELHRVLGVEAVGIGLKDDTGGGRARQLMHRGPLPMLLDQHRAWREAVERELMPTVLRQRELALWADLSLAPQSWAAPAAAAGLTSIAATPLCSSIETQGIVWLARRGGERIERHHLYMLETLAPLIAARTQIAQLLERLSRANLSDPLTGLPSQEQFDHLLHTTMRVPGAVQSVLIARLDGWDQRAAGQGRDAADAALRAAAGRVRGVLRQSNALARLHGPTFAVLAPTLTSADAPNFAERVRAAIRHGEGGNGTTASIGVASSDTDGGNPYDLRELAILRAEQAHRLGGDRAVCSGDGPGLAAG